MFQEDLFGILAQKPTTPHRHRRHGMAGSRPDPLTSVEAISTESIDLGRKRPSPTYILVFDSFRELDSAE